MRFISHHEVERRLICDGVRVVVVGKFCVRDFISPGTRVRPTEDPKVCFNLLVDMFCFAIGLRMVYSGKREVVVEEFP